MRRAMVAGSGLALVAALTACDPVIPAAAPANVVRATWSMDEIGGKRMLDGVLPAQNGKLGSGVIAAGGVHEFPGWVGNVDPYGQLVGTLPPSVGQTTVADPNHELEPIDGRFSVGGRILMRLTAYGTLPIGKVGDGYNVIQKARASNAGGFWKVEVRGNGAGVGHVRCTVGDGISVVTAESQGRVDDGQWHVFACHLGAGALTVVVDGLADTVDASVLGDVTPVERFSNSVVLGKKPDSIDPSDSFSGWLDDVSIASG